MESIEMKFGGFGPFIWVAIQPVIKDKGRKSIQNG